MKKINLDQYLTDIYFTDDIDEFNRKTDNNLKIDCVGGACASNNKGTIIIAVFNDQISTLSHEIFHAIVKLSDRIGAPVDGSTDEHNAYITGFLMKKIINLKRKKEWLLK